MKKILIMLIAVAVLGIAGGNNSWSAVGLPTANFSGNVRTTAGVAGGDPGSLSLDHAIITKINYLDTSSVTGNGPGESMIGMAVNISGATRAGDYAFTTAVITVSHGTFNYFSATLSDILFVEDPYGKWYLNPGLDIYNPSTLNMTNVVLNTDADHPSRYINELRSIMGTNSALGMKMILTIVNGSLAGDSSSDISTGLLDGTPPVVAAPSGARSMGFWKTHNDERNAFITEAAGLSYVFSSANELNYYLSMTGKKNILDKAKQQLAALMLNVASSLSLTTQLHPGELEILQLIDPSSVSGAVVGDAVTAIENAILSGTDFENAKDLGDEINNRDEKSNSL